MATQFPNDPDADRFIDGIQSMPDGSALADLGEDEVPDVEEQPDGSAIVNFKDEGEEGELPLEVDQHAERAGHGQDRHGAPRQHGAHRALHRGQVAREAGEDVAGVGAGVERRG